VFEQGKGVAELVAVEGPLRLAHDHGVEAAVRVGERGQELAGLGADAAADRAGLVDVEDSVTITPPCGSMSDFAAGVLPGAEDSGSCRSSVETRSQDANRIVFSVRHHSLSWPLVAAARRSGPRGP